MDGVRGRLIFRFGQSHRHRPTVDMHRFWEDEGLGEEVLREQVCPLIALV